MDTQPSPHCLKPEEIRAARCSADLPIERGIVILDQAYGCKACLKICGCAIEPGEAWKPSSNLMIQSLRAVAGTRGWSLHSQLLEETNCQVRYSGTSDPMEAFTRFDEFLDRCSSVEPEDPFFVSLRAKRAAYLAERLFPYKPDEARGHLGTAMALLEQAEDPEALRALVQRIYLTLIYYDNPALAAQKFTIMLIEAELHDMAEFELRLDFTRFLFEVGGPPEAILEHIDWMGTIRVSGVYDAESLYLMSLVGDPLYRKPREEWGEYSNQVRPMKIRFAPQEQKRAFVQEWHRFSSTFGNDLDHQKRMDDGFLKSLLVQWLLGEDAEPIEPDVEDEAQPG